MLGKIAEFTYAKLLPLIAQFLKEKKNTEELFRWELKLMHWPERHSVIRAKDTATC